MKYSRPITIEDLELLDPQDAEVLFPLAMLMVDDGRRESPVPDEDYCTVNNLSRRFGVDDSGVLWCVVLFNAFSDCWNCYQWMGTFWDNTGVNPI